VIPVACGIVIVLVGIFVFFAVRHFNGPLVGKTPLVSETVSVDQVPDVADVLGPIDLEVPRLHVEYYRNPAIAP
jgi:hypothetical protein